MPYIPHRPRPVPGMPEPTVELPEPTEPLYQPPPENKDKKSKDGRLSVGMDRISPKTYGGPSYRQILHSLGLA